MVRFRAGFISGQTRDGWEKPEIENRNSRKLRKSKKGVVPESGKKKNIDFPCGS